MIDWRWLEQEVSRLVGRRCRAYVDDAENDGWYYLTIKTRQRKPFFEAACDLRVEKTAFDLPLEAFAQQYLKPAAAVLRDEWDAAQRLDATAQRLLSTIPCDE